MYPQQFPPPTPNRPPNDALPPEHLRAIAILKDVGIVFGLTFVGGFVIGFVGAIAGVLISTPILALVNFVLATIGFMIAGLRAPQGNRWPHLMLVAAGVWLGGLVNVPLGVPVVVWALGIVVVAITMALGGAISMAIKP
jgi:hypothetical protein